MAPTLPKTPRRPATTLDAEPMEAARMTQPNEAVIRQGYSDLTEPMERFEIPPKDIWNMDEHGCKSGVTTTNEAAVGSRAIADASGSTTPRTKIPGNTNWCTLIECRNPFRETVPP